MRAKVLDPTEHYPLPILHGQRFRGSGITLGCTHADCRWVLDRQLILGEDLKELFALFHPHEPTGVRNVGILGHPAAADEPIPYEPVIEQPVVTVHTPPCLNIACSKDYGHLSRCDGGDSTKVSECPCPPTMSRRLRKVYYPECPLHGAEA
jgi:hypothetical protein